MEQPGFDQIHLRISIPYVFPNVSQYNNLFTYQIYGWPFPTTITIPVGQYNAYDLLNFLNNNANLKSDGFVFSYSSITKMITITNSLWNFTIFQNLSTIDLGLTNMSSSAGVLVATKVLNLIFTNNIYVDFGELNTGNITSLTKKISSILARVPIAGEFGTMLTWNNLTGYYSQITSTSYASLHVRLLDDKGRTLQLNGLNWSCSLELYYVENDQSSNIIDRRPRFSWEI